MYPFEHKLAMTSDLIRAEAEIFETFWCDSTVQNEEYFGLEVLKITHYRQNRMEWHSNAMRQPRKIYPFECNCNIRTINRTYN